MTDFLAEKRREIDERLTETSALVEEFHRLEAASRALSGVGDGEGESDFLAEKRREIEERLDEIRPRVDEHHRLEAASRALAGVDGGGGGSRARRPGAARSTSGGGDGRRGRPKGSGNRAAEALDLIKSRPGITIPEMAEEMGIKQNYLYRVVPGLQKDGKVTKSGKGWHIRD